MKTITILLFMTTAAVAQDWTLMDLEPGAYVEKLGEVALQDRNVEIYFRLNLKEIGKEIDDVANFRDTILTACNEVSIHRFFADDCGHFFRVSSHTLEELNFKYEKLVVERSKRGAINFLGTASKYLFGTMNDDDREDIRLKIDSLQKSDVETLKFNFKYANIIEKTVANVNTTIAICNHNGKLISEVQRRFGEVANSVNEHDRELRFMKYFTDIVQTFFLSFQETKDRIQETHQTLIDLSNGIFNTRLISYKEIVKSLETIVLENKRLELPISLSNPDYDTIRKLIKFGVVRQGEELVVVFTLPLIQDESLTVYRLYPIPEIKSEVGTFVNLKSEVILVDAQFNRFIGTSKDNLDKSCTLHQNMWYCRDFNLRKEEKSGCEVAILKEKFNTLAQKCELKVATLSDLVFIKTEDKNTYIVISPHLQEGNMIVNGRLQPIKFNGTQLLKVTTLATLQTDHTEIRFTENNIKINASYIKFPPLDLSINDLHLSYVKGISKKFSKVVYNKEDLMELSDDVEEMKQDLNDKLKNQELQERTNSKHGLLAIGSIITIIAIIAVASAVLYLFKNKLINIIVREITPPHEADPNPQNEGAEAQHGDA